MFASGIIARLSAVALAEVGSAYHWQIWVEACGGTEQAVTAYAVLCDVETILSLRSDSGANNSQFYFLSSDGFFVKTTKFLCG